MSSLRATIRKGNLFDIITVRELPEAQKFYRYLQGITRTALASPDTMLVNIQSVYADINVEWKHKARGFLFGEAPPRPMPPFQRLWLEYEVEEGGIRQRNGVLIRRATFADCVMHIIGGDAFGSLIIDNRSLSEWATAPEKSLEILERTATLIDVYFWVENTSGHAGVAAAGFYALSAEGDYMTSARAVFPFPEPPETQERDTSIRVMQVQAIHGLVLHALARMNCANAELRVMDEAKFPASAKASPTPACVWHTIHVRDAPERIRRTGRNALRSESAPQREHWIRGHYADYRRGPGLFGNPKLRKTFWIPEHQVGDPRLGCVIPEYIIH